MPAHKGNQYAIGNKGGRPPIFKNAKQLAKKVDAYFEYIKGEFHGSGKKKVWDRQPEPATICGLTLYLGFAHRSTLDDYEEVEEFSNIIKRARLRVAFEYEKKLSDQKPTGPIFALKNMGWSDNKSIELTGDPEKPMQVNNTVSNIDYSKLSTEVLEAIVLARKPSNE